MYFDLTLLKKTFREHGSQPQNKCSLTRFVNSCSEEFKTRELCCNMTMYRLHMLALTLHFLVENKIKYKLFKVVINPVFFPEKKKISYVNLFISLFII